MNIERFLRQVREADISVTPKMHILEHHVPVFVRQWKHRLCYFGEQGGEKLHATLVWILLHCEITSNNVYLT